MASPSDLSRIAIVATTAADSSGTIVVDAAGRRWHRQGVAASVNVMWFGAKGDWNGTTGTDDTAAIQAAIVALPAEGGEVVFPPKSFLISSPIKLGNGSTSASSTRNGIILRGVAGAMSPFAATLGVTFASAGTEIIWAPGAASAWMIQVLGPVQGCGLKNIFLNGRGIANGIQLLSASFGDYENVAVENCTGPSLLLDTNRAGVSINTMTNRFHNLFINLPDAASTQGIVLDGDTTQNACFNDFQNVLITLAATHVCWAFISEVPTAIHSAMSSSMAAAPRPSPCCLTTRERVTFPVRIHFTI